LLGLLELGRPGAHSLHKSRVASVAGFTWFGLLVCVVESLVDLMPVAARHTRRTCLLSHEFSAVSKK
jgi:hypothetical protein